MKLDIIDREYIDKAMSYNSQMLELCEKLIGLAFDNCLKQDYDKCTTKLTADIPAVNWDFLRLHFLQGAMSSQDTDKVSISYGESIGQNKRPSGNMSSRLLTVVEACRPLSRLALLTKLTGAFTMNAVTSKETFFINIPSLGLVFTFENKADALAFADEAQAQYPEHKIERWVNRQFTDSWGEVYIVDSVKGNIHKVFTDKQKAVAYYERLAMEFADTIIYTSEWSKEAISALEGR